MNNFLQILGALALRSPRKVLVMVFVMLVFIAASTTYAGFLVIGALSLQLGINRFLVGLLLGLLFARLPAVRQGKLATIGLLPKPARRPLMVFLLVLCLLWYLVHAQFLQAAFIGFALSMVLGFAYIRRRIVERFKASFFPPAANDGRSAPNTRSNPDVIDVEFREKKD